MAGLQRTVGIELGVADHPVERRHQQLAMAAAFTPRRGNDALCQHVPCRFFAIRMRELAFTTAQIIPGPVERGRHDTDIILIEHPDRPLHVVTRHWWFIPGWRPFNAPQQELFRNANLRWVQRLSEIRASFPIWQGVTAVSAGIILIEAFEQFDNVRRERFLGRGVVIFDRFPDLRQHDVSEVRGWPIAALGSHDGLFFILQLSAAIDPFSSRCPNVNGSILVLFRT